MMELAIGMIAHTHSMGLPEWFANFTGGVGALTGIGALIITWRSHRHAVQKDSVQLVASGGIRSAPNAPKAGSDGHPPLVLAVSLTNLGREVALAEVVLELRLPDWGRWSIGSLPPGLRQFARDASIEILFNTDSFEKITEDPRAEAFLMIKLSTGEHHRIPIPEFDLIRRRFKRIMDERAGKHD